MNIHNHNEVRWRPNWRHADIFAAPAESAGANLLPFALSLVFVAGMFAGAALVL